MILKSKFLIAHLFIFICKQHCYQVLIELQQSSNYLNDEISKYLGIQLFMSDDHPISMEIVISSILVYFHLIYILFLMGYNNFLGFHNFSTLINYNFNF